MEEPSTLLRALRPGDDLVELTALLHAAYAPLAAAGMRSYASHRDVQATAERAGAGECCWYQHPEVATIGQLGVHPG